MDISNNLSSFCPVWGLSVRKMYRNGVRCAVKVTKAEPNFYRGAPWVFLPRGIPLIYINIMKGFGASLRTAENQNMKPKATPCDECLYYDTDDETGQYDCQLDLDEDDMVQFLNRDTARCPYYRYYNEYKSVQKQN